MTIPFCKIWVMFNVLRSANKNLHSPGESSGLCAMWMILLDIYVTHPWVKGTTRSLIKKLPFPFYGFFFELCVKSKVRYKKSKVINGVKGENRLARHIYIIAESARHVKGGCCGSRSFYPLHGCEFLLLRQSVGKEYFKLRINLAPIPASAGPFSCNVYLS